MSRRGITLRGGPSPTAIRWALRRISDQARTRAVRHCAICGGPIGAGERMLRLNGIRYHLRCAPVRPGHPQPS